MGKKIIVQAKDKFDYYPLINYLNRFKNNSSLEMI